VPRQAAGDATCPSSAHSRQVGDATETLLTKAEQVSDDGRCAAGYFKAVTELAWL
jgi:hypothetical protein